MELNGKFFLDDVESGEWREVTKEEHDAHLALIKSFADSAVKHGYKGQFYLLGTFDNDSFDNLEKLWKQNVRSF